MSEGLRVVWAEDDDIGARECRRVRGVRNAGQRRATQGKVAQRSAPFSMSSPPFSSSSEMRPGVGRYESSACASISRCSTIERTRTLLRGLGRSSSPKLDHVLASSLPAPGSVQQLGGGGAMRRRVDWVHWGATCARLRLR